MEDNENFSGVKKAKTHKGRIYLEKLMPKAIEDSKSCLFLNTKNSSEIMRLVLSDLYMSRKEYSRKLGRKNEFSCAFADAGNIEFLADKNHTALFCYTSDTKKRAQNLVLGSLFNNKILDMFEFEVTNFIPIEYFKKDIKIDSCMKPIIIFQGDVFETDFQYDRMKKFFLDFFRLHDLDDADISNLRRLIVISSSEVGDKEVKIRSYQIEGPIQSKDHAAIASGANLDFTEVGPSLNLKVRRIQLGTEELYKMSLKQPKQVLLKPKKNIEEDSFGTRGRVHPLRQNLNAMALRKYKKILGKKRFKSKDKTTEGDAGNVEEKENKPKNEELHKKRGVRTGPNGREKNNSARPTGGKRVGGKKFVGKKNNMDEF